jgi:predicted transglutaminase-like cysteine proteinase
MRYLNKLLPIALLAVVVNMGSASAAFNRHISKTLLLPPEAPQLIEDSVEMTPIAFLKFCINNSSQCGAVASDRRIDLTEEAWAEIVHVNSEVNQRIRPDVSKGGFDWSLSTTYGNCNDYAVQKRKALLDLGMPASALSLSVVRTSWGEGHLVLTVRTSRGDYVLDNLRHAILPWNRTGYHWDRVQSASNPQTWVRTASSTPAPRFFRTESPANIAARPQTVDAKPDENSVANNLGGLDDRI